MKISARLLVALFLTFSFAFAQNGKKAGVFDSAEIKKLAPAGFYFDGQSAPTQLRNTVGFRASSGKVVLVGLLDTAGYASDVQQKFQGFFITETKLNIDGSELSPGEYGFGFSKEGKFVVMDVAAHDLLTVSAGNDEKLAHPVPLRMVEEAGSYKLYGGRKFVTIKAE
ncbi:MAG TPA: hypothetical protein VKV39_13795 [Candidatus Sulfotelmatobacter sp.]|nr:hypothetical protein [Candidatus Sulfotelmatobacter sp.]